MSEATQCWILELPYDVLSIVLGLHSEEAERPEVHYHRQRTASLAALALTCKYFHRLATPFLYENISVVCGGSRSNVDILRRSKLLYHTLRLSPSLREHSRTLIMDSSYLPWVDMSICNITHEMSMDLVRWLRAIKRFYVDTPAEPATGYRQSTSFDLGEILRVLVSNVLSLEYLAIHNEANQSYSLLET